MVVLNSAALAGIGGGDFATAFSNPNEDATSVILTFGLGISFMIASLIVASKLGAYGAQSTIQAGKTRGGGALASTVGAAAGRARRIYDYGSARVLLAANAVPKPVRDSVGGFTKGAYHAFNVATLGGAGVAKAAVKGGLKTGIPKGLQQAEEY